MTRLETGARQLPLRHLSIRVPWNDTGWTGCVCQKPAENVSCLILPRIRETRDDAKEAALAGRSWEQLDASQLPPCVGERGGFMAPYALTRTLRHPYSDSSEAHKHFLPTSFRYPAYSAACIPFDWMRKDAAQEKVRALELGFAQDAEDEAHRAMGFPTEWVQTRHNQRVMLDTFFSAIEPQRSLCFFYAKRTPLLDDARRVVIGAGWVTHVGECVEYEYSQRRQHDSVIWERAVQHSIRPGFNNGFLLPYHELVQYLDDHPEEDPAQYVAFAPDEHFWSFSYGAEHVTNDGAIGALLSCARALQNIERVVAGPWERVRQWIDQRLNELWHMRGPCPGLGAALTAFGISSGALLAMEIESSLASEESADPWPAVDDLLRDPTGHPQSLSKHVTATLSRKWQALPAERRALLQLLSRFELTSDQATRYYVHEDKTRKDLRIEVADADIIANPYLLYEIDRIAPDPISLAVVDRGLFPAASIRVRHPLATPSRVDDPTDPRRVRAFVVRQLEGAADAGHTLQARSQIITEIRELDVDPGCPVDGDLMEVVEETFLPVVHRVDMRNGSPAYQLERLHTMGAMVRNAVLKRLQGKRHEADIPWRDQLDTVLKAPVTPGDQAEENARAEKAAALQELFASRMSVLIGPAGTGKTTLLKVLCNEPLAANGGVLLLAPTGKARVRLEQQTGIKGGQTIAQFLLPLDRYEPQTGAYRLSSNDPYKGKQTVIIDEASMLTEEQLAAVLDGLAGVQRLILVGDPRQLPPIGAGRPFLDIVRQLAPEKVETLFPRIGQGYAELTVQRRQKGTARDDLLLAAWFSGQPVDAGADEIWSRIDTDEVSEHLRFVQWTGAEDLREKLLEVLAAELGFQGVDDVSGFEQSLGGTPYNNGIFFWPGRNGESGACGKVEDWQILSPVRNEPHGVEAINRFIQTTYRTRTKQFATQKWRKIPKPMGREEIIYGDKVINVRNHHRDDVWPADSELRYVANGEIGIVVGQFKGRNANYQGPPWKIEVEFSSQPSYRYGYSASSFGEEAAPTLELAYALTVHKVQGSEFGLTLLIIPNPCRLLSRELLYTALTRQQQRVVVFHQGDRHDLMRYSGDVYSEAARRLTNLFIAPQPVELQQRFLEEGLIHRTRRGDSVRSKSEVIIADLLHSKKINYTYELPLRGTDGLMRYPDFTFEDDELGQTFYWEHLGMMRDPAYRRRWNDKLEWYLAQDIRPADQGGGVRGALIITQDDDRGGIRSDEIEMMLDRAIAGS